MFYFLRDTYMSLYNQIYLTVKHNVIDRIFFLNA